MRKTLQNCNENNRLQIFLENRQTLLVKKKKKNKRKLLIPERINLTEEENDFLLTNRDKVAKELNSFFANVVKNLNILNYEDFDSLEEKIDDPTTKAIAKWKNYPNILTIASEYKNSANVFFSFVFKENALTEIKALHVSKAIQESNILFKIMKENENFFSEAYCFYFNKSLENCKFSNCLKLAYNTPVFEKDARTSKNNNGPVSIIPVFSKIFTKKVT